MKKKTSGLDPKTIPPIYCCKNHDYFINLHPKIQDGKKRGYRVVCPECGVTGEWGDTVPWAIMQWNEVMRTEV
jgi:hypothetical protein